jgi:hypothetical protein
LDALLLEIDTNLTSTKVLIQVLTDNKSKKPADYVLPTDRLLSVSTELLATERYLDEGDISYEWITSYYLSVIGINDQLAAFEINREPTQNWLTDYILDPKLPFLDVLNSGKRQVTEARRKIIERL